MDSTGHSLAARTIRNVAGDYEQASHGLEEDKALEARFDAGYSIEFTNREDGWPGLGPYYGLELGAVRALEHGLADFG